jgi:hypothetical protein
MPGAPLVEEEQHHDHGDDRREADGNPEQSEVIVHECVLENQAPGARV